MKKLFSAAVYASALLCSSFALTAHAESPEQVPAAVANASAATFNAEKLKQTISQTLGLEVSTARKTPMPGLAEIVTEQGLFYTSYDGEYFIQGKLFNLGPNVTNLTETSLAQVRLDGMAKFEKDMIVFPAKNEKHVVTVFTDITCGYCRKLHNSMEEYNDLGITVRYLAYPRAGVYQSPGTYTQGFEDLRSIWCNEDPAKAMTRAKAGSSVARRICDKPVEDNFKFGRQVGVSGTPAIILANGFMLPGYRDADDLKNILENL
ncbi:bifunctional protein-disulfide isomerase/oxidoreductase DsbC [Thalassotalea euphylliae]|uniref:Thiol:disulfide interchange protein n=1 Tax=Thalassotalea euphylliae TaxID=1655234 RepID=A0A3E0UC86_9GAMM|nr:bifunctional protein-disulfide isomerase/oxidoreductase DsbC [Thalassotalea euphylliae]REL34499.1 bifunctional protein-disulfide isomerase/oxidoreductase DsbC [Thalassotalea euphylliae]